jgi:hypothetical protein
MKKLGWLVVGTSLLWALLIFPAWLLWGDLVWVQSLSALSLCLVPALITMGWVTAWADVPERQLAAVLGGTGIRLALALGGGLLLYKTLPQTFTDAFWLWMGIFYMFILALETLLIVKKQPDQLR